MTTIKDIALKANVSIGTVSRVLNFDETLSVYDSTREKINSNRNYPKKVLIPTQLKIRKSCMKISYNNI